MRKDSIFILVFSLLITLGIVGGAYYMSVARPLEQTPSGSRQQGSSANKPAVGDVARADSSRNERTDQIIKCVDPDKGEFWTNAVTCEDADLHNRLSHAQPLVSLPAYQDYGNENYRTPESEARSSRSKVKPTLTATGKPSLRGPAKAPPDGLPAKCRFPVGQAAELERKMSAKDDPRESMWVEDYCKWRCEVIKNRCSLPKDFYFYDYGELCRYNREIEPCT